MPELAVHHKDLPGFSSEPISGVGIKVPSISSSLSDGVKRVGSVAVSSFNYLLNFIAWLFGRYNSGDKSLQNRVNQFYFSQQMNEGCHLISFINLRALQALDSNNFDLSNLTPMTRRQWLGENQRQLQSWNVALAEALSPENKQKYPALHEFVQQALVESPTNPNFYEPSTERSFDGISGIFNMSQVPFFFSDFTRIQDLSFHLGGCINLNARDLVDRSLVQLHMPLVKDREGQYLIYKRSTKEYCSIDDLNWLSVEGDGRVSIEYNQMQEADYEEYSIPKQQDYKIQMIAKNILGFKEVAVVKDLPHQIQDVNGHAFYPYQMGLFKLIALTMGIDENNEPINEGHPLYNLTQELQNIMGASVDNPWCGIQKKQLLQYHLAAIFKAHPDLYELASKTVSVIHNGWANYQKMMAGGFYREDGSQYTPEQVQKYLPGKEQALAYYFTQNLRYLWYFSQAPIGIFKTPTGKGVIKTQMSKAFYSKLKKGATKVHTIERAEDDRGDSIQTSFMEVWKNLLAILQQKVVSGQMDEHVVSFDEHGWVFSVNPSVVQMTASQPEAYDPELLASLGFGGVESFSSSSFGSVWYKV